MRWPDGMATGCWWLPTKRSAARGDPVRFAAKEMAGSVRGGLLLGRIGRGGGWIVGRRRIRFRLGLSIEIIYIGWVS